MLDPIIAAKGSFSNVFSKMKFRVRFIFKKIGKIRKRCLRWVERQQQKKKVEDQSSRDLMVMATKLFGVFTTSKKQKKSID
jgi:hypothetical protein